MNQRAKEIHRFEPDVFIAWVLAIVAIPVAGYALNRERKEFWIGAKKFTVERAVKCAQILVDYSCNVDHVLAQELNNKRGNPRLCHSDDVMEMTLTNESTTVPSQQAINQVLLVIRETGGVNEVSLVVDAIGNRDCFVPNPHMKWRSRSMLRLGEMLQSA